MVDVRGSCPEASKNCTGDAAGVYLSGRVIAKRVIASEPVRRGTRVLITSGTDPKTAVVLWLDGSLPTLAATPKEQTGCTAGAKDGP